VFGKAKKVKTKNKTKMIGLLLNLIDKFIEPILLFAVIYATAAMVYIYGTLVITEPLLAVIAAIIMLPSLYFSAMIMYKRDTDDLLTIVATRG